MSDELAVEKTKEPLRLELSLAIEDVLALQDLLARTEPKGRSEMRNHSKIFRELNRNCREFVDSAKTEFKWRAGTVRYEDEAAIEYLFHILDKRIESGIPGHLSVGYANICEALDGQRMSRKR